MYRWLLALVLLPAFADAQAAAGTAVVSWVAPTTCVGGAPATSCPTTEFRIYGALQGQPKVQVGTAVKSDSSFTVQNLAPGTYCYEVTTFATASSPQESVHSAESCKVVPIVPNPQPNPPTLVTVTTTAYNVTKQTDKFVLVPVGTVPLQTACNSTQYVNGYNVVPRATVTWTGSAHPIVVVAKCA